MIGKDNKHPVLFDETDNPKLVQPINGKFFQPSEVFELLKATENDDLDRIEVFNGALYCIELRSRLYYNRTATQFWYDNARNLNREHGILGNAIFIPKDLDLYDGMDTLHIE